MNKLLILLLLWITLIFHYKSGYDLELKNVDSYQRIAGNRMRILLRNTTRPIIIDLRDVLYWEEKYG